MRRTNTNINQQIRVSVYSDEKATRGSINSNQAKTYAEIAEIYAKKAEQAAKDVAENIQKYADKNFVHEQGLASNEWIVTHNLGKEPSITITDSAGTEVEGDVKHIDLNTTKLTFSAPFKGKAIFN